MRNAPPRGPLHGHRAAPRFPRGRGEPRARWPPAASPPCAIMRSIGRGPPATAGILPHPAVPRFGRARLHGETSGAPTAPHSGRRPLRQRAPGETGCPAARGRSPRLPILPGTAARRAMQDGGPLAGACGTNITGPGPGPERPHGRTGNGKKGKRQRGAQRKQHRRRCQRCSSGAVLPAVFPPPPGLARKMLRALPCALPCPVPCRVACRVVPLTVHTQIMCRGSAPVGASPARRAAGFARAARISSLSSG